jgi:hypothetical protein
MPRTAATKKRYVPKPPLVQYERLEFHAKYICWQYFQYLETDGQVGWNPSQAGSVFHQRTSNYLLSLGSDSWFRHLAKQMVTLAQALKARNEKPFHPGPIPESAETIHPTEPSQPPAMPTIPSITSPRTPSRNMVTGLSQAPSPSVAIANDPYPPLSYPTTFGTYKWFNFTSRREQMRTVIKVLVHNGLKRRDIQFEWITPRILKIQIAWPEWFKFAEQMANFCTDEDGNVLFPPEHALTVFYLTIYDFLGIVGCLLRPFQGRLS